MFSLKSGKLFLEPQPIAPPVGVPVAATAAVVAVAVVAVAVVARFCAG
jgi:hypothetical protein